MYLMPILAFVLYLIVGVLVIPFLVLYWIGKVCEFAGGSALDLLAAVCAWLEDYA